MEIKKLYISLLIIFTSLNIYSQNDKYSYSISGEFGLNQHGTGDIKGFTYGLKFNKFLNKRFDLIIGFEGNLNDNRDEIFIWEDPDGNTYDSTPHNVIAGIQLSGGVGFNIINSSRNKFGLNPSIFARYQADSMFNTTITDYPILTGYPVPIRTYIREEPGNAWSAGVLLRLYYNYKINGKYLLGINPGFQYDTNEDTMIFLTTSLGINL